MAAVFWLVLIASPAQPGGIQMMHVGTFTSLTNCSKFAASYTTPVKPPTTGPSQNPLITMVCVQANDPGGKPPAG